MDHVELMVPLGERSYQIKGVGASAQVRGRSFHLRFQIGIANSRTSFAKTQVEGPSPNLRIVIMK